VLRLFVAVDLPVAERLRLAALQTTMTGARWIPTSDLHLTLRFLGAVPSNALPALEAALARVSGPAFSLALSGVGVFPSPATRRAAHVLWAGIAPAPALVALKAAIDGALGPDTEGRPYTPHVTLARLDQAPAAALGAFLDRHRALAGAPFPVTAFHLYESRGGAYTILRSFALER
jgi:2'-5' RNA ligase